MAKTSYNERSWAIDLISEINAYSSAKNKTIDRAGGETTMFFCMDVIVKF